MSNELNPYIKFHRRTHKFTVYAPIDDKMKAIGIYTNYSKAKEIYQDALEGKINTTRYPNYTRTLPSRFK